MLLSALALFCCTAMPVDTPPSTPEPVSATSTTPSIAKPGAPAVRDLPDAPVAKLVTDSDDVASSSADPISPASQPGLNSPVKPAGHSRYETVQQRKLWYGLIVASHSAAVFDAYSTRRAITNGYGTESDPLLRPFAHSGAIYVATQVSPAVLDYVGYRMMHSNHEVIRRFWWIPQVAGTSFSLSAGIHNYRLAP